MSRMARHGHPPRGAAVTWSADQVLEAHGDPTRCQASFGFPDHFRSHGLERGRVQGFIDRSGAVLVRLPMPPRLGLLRSPIAWPFCVPSRARQSVHRRTRAMSRRPGRRRQPSRNPCQAGWRARHPHSLTRAAASALLQHKTDDEGIENRCDIHDVGIAEAANAQHR